MLRFWEDIPEPHKVRRSRNTTLVPEPLKKQPLQNIKNVCPLQKCYPQEIIQLHLLILISLHLFLARASSTFLNPSHITLSKSICFGSGRRGSVGWSQGLGEIGSGGVWGGMICWVDWTNEVDECIEEISRLVLSLSLIKQSFGSKWAKLSGVAGSGLSNLG